ncbi:MAG TPA: hypothetical protein VMU18_13675 [Rhodoblastus sp.]|nr:hypothetical protein [Rhodoblastus sp.]
MHEKPETPERKSEPAKAPAALSSAKLAEKQRLAEALRANLRRRKEQARSRKAKAAEDAGDRQS